MEWTRLNLTRRQFGLASLGLAAQVSWFSLLRKAWAVGENPSADARPNLLVIQTDQQSCWTLGAYGGTEIATPQIDAIASHGLTFDHFFTNSPLCTPSRSCFMTGRYPYATGTSMLHESLNEGEITLSQALSDAGYHTGYIGKWHLNGTGQPPGFATVRKSWGVRDHRYMFNRGHFKKIADTPEGPVSFPDHVVGDETTYTTDWLTTKAIEFITTVTSRLGNAPQATQRPFSLFLEFPDPHPPYSVRAPYSKMFDPEAMTFPISVPSHKNPVLRADKAQYCGAVKCIDDNVGRILQTLAERDLLRNTLIVFTTDHGDYMGEHGLRNKNDIYESAIRIPLIMSWGERWKGERFPSVASSVDFMPTILGILGVTCESDFHGRDCFRSAETAADLQGAHIVFEDPSRAALYTKDYALAYKDGGKTGFLFDRRLDPHQMKNLFHVKEMSPHVAALTKAMLRQYRNHPTLANAWLNQLDA